MSATKDVLTAQMKEAMKSGDKERLAVIRMLLAEVKNAAINDPREPGRERTEAETIAVIAGYHKSLSKTLTEYPPDRQAPLRAELAIVETFLPKQLSVEELRADLKDALVGTAERNFGALMKILQPRYAGRVDGKTLSETLKSLLASGG